MENIGSFSVDHTKLLPGLCVSRKDKIGDNVLTTFDIRITCPNHDLYIDPKAMHPIEHVGAVYLRSHPSWGDKVVYFGPMGCMTGCYLILKGDLTPMEVLPLVRETFSCIADYDGRIPGCSARQCGNYRFHDLLIAKVHAECYVRDILDKITDENIKYPMTI